MAAASVRAIVFIGALAPVGALFMQGPFSDMFRNIRGVFQEGATHQADPRSAAAQADLSSEKQGKYAQQAKAANVMKQAQNAIHQAEVDVQNAIAERNFVSDLANVAKENEAKTAEEREQIRKAAVDAPSMTMLVDLDKSMAKDNETDFFKSIDKEAQREMEGEREAAYQKKMLHDAVEQAEREKEAAQLHASHAAERYHTVKVSVDIAKQAVLGATKRAEAAQEYVAVTTGALERAKEKAEKATQKFNDAYAKVAHPAWLEGRIVTDEELAEASGNERLEQAEDAEHVIELSSALSKAERSLEEAQALKATSESDLETWLKKLAQAEAFNQKADAELEKAEAAAADRDSLISKAVARIALIKEIQHGAKEAAEEKIHAAEAKLAYARKVQEASETGVEFRDTDPLPTKPGCYYKKPTGCGQRTEKVGWELDLWAQENSLEEAECLKRMAALQRGCDRQDVQVVYVGGHGKFKYVYAE